jgi:hypothetical protein
MEDQVQALRGRGAREVLEDHLAKALKAGLHLDEDLLHNYSENVVFLTSYGIFEGHEGFRELCRFMRAALHRPRFSYRMWRVSGEMGLLEWTAESDRACIPDGTDSYLVRDGHIVAQTIHYTVQPA